MSEQQTLHKPRGKRKSSALPDFKDANRLLADLYAADVIDALRKAIDSGAARVCIEVDIPTNAPGLQQPVVSHGVHIKAALPRYVAYRVIETNADIYHIRRDVSTREEALQAVEELRHGLTRGFRLQVIGVCPNGGADGVELLQWGVKRSG